MHTCSTYKVFGDVGVARKPSLALSILSYRFVTQKKKKKKKKTSTSVLLLCSV